MKIKPGNIVLALALATVLGLMVNVAFNIDYGGAITGFFIGLLARPLGFPLVED